MKLRLLALVCATQLALASASLGSKKHVQVLKRQASSPPSAPKATTGPPPPPSPSSSSSAPPPPANVPTATASGIPPLSKITMGMPSAPTPVVTASFSAGAVAPISGAPPLPTPFVFMTNEWPAQDRVPETNSPEVQQWMKELEGYDIPNITPTTDGSCAGDIEAASQAAQRGWWTCGGYTRSTDIVACPDKLTWGVSFDDGPGPYTQTLLDYLNSKNISATFFLVGSRVIERPTVVIEEYMAGHEISVHTWSHRPLTSLTNEQIVAELGWTRKAIQRVLGVSPTTMRPPFGDIDDRVRAISLAMGMVPLLWTRTPSGGVFDTNDWKIAAGEVTGLQSFQTFEAIFNNASQLDYGFIVLQHDVHEITVDMAVGYTLDAALNHNPKFTLKAIGQCTNTPATDLYLETTKNTTFPYPNNTKIDVDGDGKAETSIGAANSNDAALMRSSIFTVLLGALIAAFSGMI